MNKKHFKSLSLFLTLIIIMLTITTVCATETNHTKDANTISQQTTMQPVVTKEKTNDLITKYQITDEKKSSEYNINQIKDNTTKTVEKDYQKIENNKNAIKTTLTVGSSQNVYVGDQMSIYGKLSANGKDLSYQNITVSVDGKKYYLTTTKYGNYNFKITPTTIGTKIIASYYAGTGMYTSSTASSNFTVNKNTLITLGSTKNVYVGSTVKIYGKLTSKGKNLAYKTVTIDVNGKQYSVKTSQYGNYNINHTATNEGYYRITASYTGTNTYTSDTNNTYYYANKKTSLLTLGSTKNAYIGDTVTIYGKLTANGKNLANQKVTIKVDGYSYTVTTTQYGNYNLKIGANKEGYNSISASYSGNTAIIGDTNNTYFYANKKTGLLTLGSTKNVYVGSKVCIYGKLTANGKNLAYQKVSINIDNENYYSVITNKYGNYNINITSTTEGYHDIYASFSGSNAITSDSCYTYFQASKQETILTIGSSEIVYRGKPFSVYGKLTDKNGRNLAYKNVEIRVGGKIYTVTTSKYGNYNINATDYGHGEKGIEAKFYGDDYYHNSTAYHTIGVQDPSIELYTYQMKNGYPQSTKQVGNDLFLTWYQTYDGQYDKGVHIELIGYNPSTDTYSDPHLAMIYSFFYFKDNKGNIIREGWESGDNTYRYHSLIPGYTPYKVFITYYETYEDDNYYDDEEYYDDVSY